MKLYSYLPERDKDEWDRLVALSCNGVFLHSRKFISYHGSRFSDQSLLFRSDDGKLQAVLPAANDPFDASRIISHPGITYGGLIIRGRIEAETFHSMIDMAIQEYRRRGAKQWLYKCVPVHLQQDIVQYDEYMLWRRGAELVRRDLWNAIVLDGRRSLSKGRRWGVAKGKRMVLQVARANGLEAYENFYSILEQSLAEWHETRPVHGKAELWKIAQLFPEEVELWTVSNAEGCLIGGTWVFKMKQQAWHTQYIASTAQGRACHALDYLIESVMEASQEEKVRFFSFGASTEQQGKVLNGGLHNFKAGFGFGVVTQDTFLINLEV